jgi:hypothetical protein
VPQAEDSNLQKLHCSLVKVADVRRLGLFLSYDLSGCCSGQAQRGEWSNEPDPAPVTKAVFPNMEAAMVLTTLTALQAISAQLL